MPKLSEETYRDRRAHILSSAKRCFARNGIAISIDEVCADANISKGAFYGYFKSKDALFEALARDHGAMLAALPPLSDRYALTEMLLERASVQEPAFARVELDSMAYATRHPVLNGIYADNARALRGVIDLALAHLPLSEGTTRENALLLLESATLGAFLSVALEGTRATEKARARIAAAMDSVLKKA